MIWVELITIGGEILSGRTQDTNFTFLARGLVAHGLACQWHTTVPDEREALTEALVHALTRADVVITTGGLGATPDDITRKVVAAVLKRQLILREDVVRALEARFARLNRPTPPNLQAQALVPLGADLIENTLGSAPGLRLRAEDGRFLYCLPGVPFEMERMAAQFVLPEIASLAPSARRHTRMLRTIGIGETVLAQMLDPVIPREVSVAYLPRLGAVDLHFAAEAESRSAEAVLDRMIQAAKEKIGTAVYAEGTEDIEELVGRECALRGWKIAVAESLTGGSLASQIVRVPGASRYFAGGIVAYANEAKTALLGVPENWIREHGAVSEAVAHSMAHGVRGRFGADVGISTTGVAGPDGGSAEKPVGLVYIGVDWPGGHSVIRRVFPSGREQVIGRTVLAALDLTRRAILGLAIDPGRER
jgi:nicotinamide-nucleotide amidase